jgi:putative acetyltransferase
MSAIVLRPYLPADAKRCLAIFRASIDGMATEDYDDEQRAAWISRAKDAPAFAGRLGEALTLLASVDGTVAGFASLKGAASIDMLYVDPAFSRRGVGATLIEALLRLAEARGVDRVASDVSDTARPLFERQGFVAERRNLVLVRDQWLGNTTMTKALAKPGASTQRH